MQLLRIIAPILPTTALYAALTSPSPDPRQQLLDVLLSLLGGAMAIITPILIQKLRSLDKELKSHRATNNVDELRTNYSALSKKIDKVQHHLDEVIAERDELKAKLEKSGEEFTSTILQLRIQHVNETKAMSDDLVAEREVNANLIRRYEELETTVANLTQRLAVLEGVNALADKIMERVETLIGKTTGERNGSV